KRLRQSPSSRLRLQRSGWLLRKKHQRSCWQMRKKLKLNRQTALRRWRRAPWRGWLQLALGWVELCRAKAGRWRSTPPDLAFPPASEPQPARLPAEHGGARRRRDCRKLAASWAVALFRL